MAEQPVPDPTIPLLVEIRDELRALNAKTPPPPPDGDITPAAATPVDGR